ncbi:MAG: PA0069 family radical SAM protein [Alphaproteobacteria bacterium]|jgi:DNA repair photolyase|nr:PA0069 family radical SAM protein [Alphaproteobacteria bacterium]
MRTRQKLSPKGRVTRDEVSAAGERFEQRGRGAISNQTGRYEPETRTAFDDGWETIEAPAGRMDTSLTAETARTLISFNRSPDIHFDRSVNPYRGCEHGCVYCFARPTHAYNGLSAGLDFESRLFFKPNGPELLRRELSRPEYVPRVIALGVNTDAFQPAEKRLRLTRALLEVFAEFNHPVSLLTKSTLIQRDIDLVAPLAEKGLARVGISLTTLDPALSRRMEPRAATPKLRLETMRALSRAGIPVIAMTAPVIPGLNDDEIEALLEASAQAGASWAGYVLLRLPYEIKDLFHEWLVEHYPERAARIVNLIREMRGGKDYDPRWFERGRGRGPHAELIAQRFRRAARAHGLDGERPPLRTDLFRPLEGPGGQFLLDV